MDKKIMWKQINDGLIIGTEEHEGYRVVKSIYWLINSGNSYNLISDKLGRILNNASFELIRNYFDKNTNNIMIEIKLSLIVKLFKGLLLNASLEDIKLMRLIISKKVG